MRITKEILVLTILQGLLPGRLCQTWEFPTEIYALVGSCVEIPCTFHPQRNSGTPGTVWYLYSQSGYLQIFNSWGSSLVLEDYKDRTSLVPGDNSCSLRIDPVRADDGDKYYYPGKAGHQRINAWTQSSRVVRLHVTDTPKLPELIGRSLMIEGHPEIFVCSAVHACASSPLSLKWNKPGQTESEYEDLSGGEWREILKLQYIPSYEDDDTQIQCTATYHNGITSQSSATLDIQYAPKNVMVSLIGNKEPLEGNNVTLACSSRSNPPPHTYEWYRAYNKTKLRLQVQTIIVLNVSKDIKPYSCVAINEVGKGESPPTEIPVQYAATRVQVVVLQQKERVTELKCSFVSSSPDVTHYTWIKDGTSLHNETGQILVLHGNEDKSGSYSCIAHNTAGSSTSAELEFNGSKDSAGYEHSPNLLLILGISAGVILLMIIVFIYTRFKACKTSSRHENPPLDTYADLVKREISNEYDTLQPSFPAQSAAGPRDLTSEKDYENLRRK